MAKRPAPNVSASRIAPRVGIRVLVQAKGSDLATVITADDESGEYVYPYHAPNDEIHVTTDEELRAAIQSIADHLELGHVKPVYTRMEEGT